MITKFKSITNLAVFQNFDWDTIIHDDRDNSLPLVSERGVNG